MKSVLPFKVTASISLIALLLVALQRGVIDAQTGIAVLGMLFNFAAGLVTHTEIPEDEWQKMKQQKASPPPS